MHELPQRFSFGGTNASYHRWYINSLPAPAERKAMQCLASYLTEPKIIRIGIDYTQHGDLIKTTKSLAEQSYPHWTCYIISETESLTDIAKLFAMIGYPGFAVRCQTCELGNITAAEINDGDFYGFLSAGETLAPHALGELVINSHGKADWDFIYSDHDWIDLNDQHLDPYFTPSWSPELGLARDYIGGFFLLRGWLFRESSKAIAVGPAWRYDLQLRAVEQTARIHRVAKVLWSAPIGNAKVDHAAELAVVRDALGRRGLSGQVVSTAIEGIRRIKWLPQISPKVSIIIPTTGKLDHLEPCIESITGKTGYRIFELILLDNSRGKHPEGIQYLKNKDLKVLECNQPFNWSRLNNLGVQQATGELLLFLNDDIEVIDPDWLSELVWQAIRPNIGAVGGLLLYPNGSIQHAGIFLVDHGGGARHLFQGQFPGEEIYQRLDSTTREVIASTGACLMVSKKCYQEVGGFDEDLPVVGNDVDFCLKLHARGYRNIWTPYCRLVHHESISRREISIESDEATMWRKWGEMFRRGDPYYNPNLALDRSDCSIRIHESTRPLTEIISDIDRNEKVLRTRFLKGFYQLVLSLNKSIGRHVPIVLKSTLKSWLFRSRKIGHRERTSLRKMSPAIDEGINLIGYVRAEMGVGEGSRAMARALEAVNKRFDVINFEIANPSRMGDLSWIHKEVKKARYGINVMHVNADLMPFAMRMLPSDLFRGKYTIGFWAWELPDFPDDWLPAFDLVDEVWVPSHFIQQAVSLKSPVPVIRIPHAVRLELKSKHKRDFFGLPEGIFLFLMMYDTYSITQRKNPQGTIAAFKQAFGEQNREVGLVIKLNNVNRQDLSLLHELIGKYKNIFIIDKVFSREEINSLLSCVDCFVSLHRSEGFGFGPAEAMSLGKPVIATNWSGNTDYMTPYNSIGIDYKLVNVGADYGPYKAYQVWAEPHVERAAYWMKKLFEDRSFAEEIGEKGKQTIDRDFSPQTVGRLIELRLDYIGAQIH